MSAKQLEQQLLADAQAAGFKVFNGTIHLPAACDVMEAFAAFAIIRENRAIEPTFRELEYSINYIDRLKSDLARYGNPHIGAVLMRCKNFDLSMQVLEVNNSPHGVQIIVSDASINKKQ